jgi:hypothetical protein
MGTSAPCFKFTENMANSAAVLNVLLSMAPSFKFFACLRLNYCIFVIHKIIVEQDSKLKDFRFESYHFNHLFFKEKRYHKRLIITNIYIYYIKIQFIFTLTVLIY